MNQRIIISMLAGFLLLTSCEESFSPKEEFVEQYSASCVIGIGSIASEFSAGLFLTSSYGVAGVDPFVNSFDPAISGASAILSYGGVNSYVLSEDTSIIYHPSFPDSVIWAEYNRYGNPCTSYTSNGIPIKYQPLTLTVELPNGERLSAQTELPRGIFFEYSYEFPHGITSNVNQWKFGEAWEITWITNEDHLYFASLTVEYEIDDIIQQKEIPLVYINNSGSRKPVYPMFNYPGKLSYKFDALDEFMQDLANGIEDKGRITILKAILNVTELDKELSAYYSSINGYLDGYSIRLDEQVYSNINGGVGIFGSYRTTTVDYRFDKQYVYSLGYQTDY